MRKICDVQPCLLLSAVLDLRLLFRKPYYMVGPYLLSVLDAGIALQGLITRVTVKLPIHRPGGRYVNVCTLDCDPVRTASAHRFPRIVDYETMHMVSSYLCRADSLA